MCKNFTIYIVRSLTNKVNSDCWDNLRIHQWKWDVSNWQYKYQLGVERISDMWQELPEFYSSPQFTISAVSAVSALSTSASNTSTASIISISASTIRTSASSVGIHQQLLRSGEVNRYCEISVELVWSQWILWDPRRFCEIRLAHRLCWVFF